MRHPWTILALAILALISPPRARAECPPADVQIKPFAHEAITVSTVAVGFTSATYAPTGQTPAILAFITVEDATARFRVDGTAPTSTTGHQLALGGELQLCGASALSAFKAIRDTSTDAKLRVTYYRQR